MLYIARSGKQKTLPWIVMLFIASLPFEQVLGMFAGITTEFKPYRLLLALVVLFAFAKNNRLLRSAREITLGFFVILTYGILLVFFWGLLGDADIASALHNLMLVTIGGAIFISLIVIITNPFWIDRIVFIFSLAVAVSIVAWNFGLGYFDVYRISGLFRNPNHFAFALTIALIYFFSRSLRSNLAVGFRIMWVLLCLPLFYYLVASGSRGALVGLATGLLFVGASVISSRSSSTQGKKLFLLALVIVSAAGGVGIMQEMNFSDRIMDRFSIDTFVHGSGRVDIWKAGLNAAFDYYFLGMGLSQYIEKHLYYVSQFDHEVYSVLLEYKLGLHSEFMVLFVEYGVIGFVVYLVIIRKIWIGLNRNSLFHESTSDISVLLKALLVSCLAQAAFQNMQIIPLYWLVLAICVAYINISEAWEQKQIAVHQYDKRDH